MQKKDIYAFFRHGGKNKIIHFIKLTLYFGKRIKYNKPIIQF